MSDRRYYFTSEQRYLSDTSGLVDENEYADDGLLYPCSDDNNNQNNNSNNNNGQDNNDETGGNQANNLPDADADKDDDLEFLQDVPYSSSSIDRSSVGSIPWADDAIKKNKLDWDRVERMLSGEEPLPSQEPELSNEIADWQRKFPNIVGGSVKPLKQSSFDSQRIRDDSGDIDSISNLSLNSLDEDDADEDDDGFLTPTAKRQPQSQQQQQQQPQKYRRSGQNLVDLLDRDLRITSVSVKLRKRQQTSHQQPQQQPPLQHVTAAPHSARLRMPPILNVLDSNRRFRGLLNNRSFVQLTQVQQQQQQLHAKSAALTHANSAERRSHYHGAQHYHQPGNRSAWHMIASNRFLNNKNAIVLPSLNLNRNRDHNRTINVVHTMDAASSQSNSSSSGGGAHNSNSSSSRTSMHHHPFGLPTTNSSNTPSTGRSISAAVHIHPRSEFATSSAFYIPYSASKFKAFK
ncbi:uncharacterized protein Dwil_GK12119 [Drosophila willistoni]|uniref:Uncharacterized protein n=1 Tax=Drosophila willistoni TaxID=7260 RepID=B4N8T9_DROWI|nr:putative mediator of RNA polymerase II transcription subunit 29 [Drosophila willistoni]EDW81540.1 uncharacterized protein Dwil_GK12119 [Drosophila willistoni]